MTCENRIINDYCSVLDPIARRQYRDKLELNGLSEMEDPYALWIDDKFMDNMTLWPPLKFGHILLLSQETRSVYEERVNVVEKPRSL